jgi:hypothetical protein
MLLSSRGSSNHQPQAAVYFRHLRPPLPPRGSLYAYGTWWGTLDAYLTSISNRLNETMKRLTVVGAVFAALTVITGVYGMNFEHMPELKWRYGYGMVWLVMAAVTGVLLYWFKKKEWV